MHTAAEKRPETRTEPLGLVVRALVELGPLGSHKMGEVVRRSGLPYTTAARAMRRAADAGLAERDTRQQTWSLADFLRPHPARAHGRPTAPVQHRIEHTMAELAHRTRRMTLLFEPALIGSRGRRLTCVIDRDGVLPALPDQQRAAVDLAPVTADPAGWIIAAYATPSPDTALVRALGIASGRGPLPGWRMTAVPVWCGSTLAGAIAAAEPIPQGTEDSTAVNGRVVDALYRAAASLNGAAPARAVS